MPLPCSPVRFPCRTVRFSVVALLVCIFGAPTHSVAQSGDAEPPIVHQYVDFRTPGNGGSGPGGAYREEGAERTMGDGQSGDGAQAGGDASSDELFDEGAQGDDQRVADQSEGGGAGPGARTWLDDDTDSASGDPYVEIYEPTVRPHKRAQVLEQIVDNSGRLEIVDPTEGQGVPYSPHDSTRAVQQTRTAELRLPAAGVHYLLPTTAPDMEIRSIRGDVPVSVERLPTGLFRLQRNDAAPQAETVVITVQEGPDYRSQIPSGFISARNPYGESLPTLLFREVGAVFATVPELAALRDVPDEEKVERLTSYFRSFDVAPLDGSDQSSLLRRIVTQRRGVCRHRAFGFVAVAQVLGLRARYVANELHAFVEVQRTDGHWYLIDLGGLVEPGAGTTPQASAQESGHSGDPVVAPANGDEPEPPSTEAGERQPDGNDEVEQSPASESDISPVSLRWEVDRHQLYRGQAVTVAGTASRDGEPVSNGQISIRVSSAGNGLERVFWAAVDGDGNWEVVVPLGAEWELGTVELKASYLSPDNAP